MDIETLALAKKYTDEHGGGGGGSYTAGDGIKIQHDEISTKLKSNGGIMVDNNGMYVNVDDLPVMKNSDTIIITSSKKPGASGATYTINKTNLGINELYAKYNGNIKAVLEYTYNGTHIMISDDIKVIGNGNISLNFSTCGNGQQVSYIFDYTTSNVLTAGDASETVATRTTATSGINVFDGYISVKPKANGGIIVDSNGVYVDDTKIQKKLTAGTGISIANDGTISVDYPNGDEEEY